MAAARTAAIAIVGGGAHRRQRGAAAADARELHGGAQGDVAILGRVRAGAEREQARAGFVAAHAHERAERGQPHAERVILERLADLAERVRITEQRQAGERLAAHAGVVVVEQLVEELARAFGLPLRDRRGRAGTHAHVAVGGEVGQARLGVVEGADGVDGDDLGVGVVAVEDRAQDLGRDRHLARQRHRRRGAHHRRRIAEARAEAAVEQRIGRRRR